MPAYKVTSHFFNGFLTVIFGGSTGIEVSTVVATSTLGELASRKDVIFKKYRKEFMGSAIAAGVSMLFGNPLAGLFFSFETIRKQNTKVFWVTHLGSILFAYLVGLLFNVHPLFDVSKLDWNFSYLSIPFWIALSIVSALYGVYMTRMVTFVKSFSWRETHPILTILVGGLVLGMFLFFLPSLYGDGYHEIKALLATDSLGFQSFIVLVLVVFFKPIVTGLTLQLGGDGGVFAPSIFSGALLDAIMSYVSMYFFQIEASAISFIILGVAFTVAATLHAPLTAIFLTFGIFHSCQMALLICT